MYLKGKHVLLGLSGSIAAYKAPELIRLYQKEGAKVSVMATPSALRFVSSLTLQTLCGSKIMVDMFQDHEQIQHIQASRNADVVVVAPASANMLAKIAAGMAEDIVSATCLASNKPVLIVPAMNVYMWKNPFVQRNVQDISTFYNVLLPDAGNLACGEEGEGRFPELSEILLETVRVCKKQSLKGKKILITAGGTREAIDPVRVITNNSSGEMALALTREAYFRGAEITVISTISEKLFTPLPRNVVIEKVQTTQEMYRAVMKQVKKMDLFISAAAVSDFKPVQTSLHKIKKSANSGFVLNLEPTIDILQKISNLKKKPFLVGFSLEDVMNISEAKRKFKEKSLQVLVLNMVRSLHSKSAEVALFSKKKQLVFDELPKTEVAQNVFDFIQTEFVV